MEDNCKYITLENFHIFFHFFNKAIRSAIQKCFILFDKLEDKTIKEKKFKSALKRFLVSFKLEQTLKFEMLVNGRH